MSDGEIFLCVSCEDGYPTVIAALNQDVAYIPNRFNYGRGGYETTPRCSPYSTATGDNLLAAVQSMLQALLAGTGSEESS